MGKSGTCTVVSAGDREIERGRELVQFGGFKLGAHDFFIAVQYQRERPGERERERYSKTPKNSESLSLVHGSSWEIFLHPSQIVLLHHYIIRTKNSNNNLFIVNPQLEWTQEGVCQHHLD